MRLACVCVWAFWAFVFLFAREPAVTRRISTLSDMLVVLMLSPSRGSFGGRVRLIDRRMSLESGMYAKEKKSMWEKGRFETEHHQTVTRCGWFFGN